MQSLIGITDMQKECSKCKVTKPLTDFTVYSRKANNPLRRGTTAGQRNVRGDDVKLNSRCKSCSAEDQREFRKRHKELTGSTNYRGSGKTTRYPTEDRELISAIRRRLSASKSNAKKCGVTCNLTEEYLYELFKQQKGICALSGVPIQIEGNSNLRLSIDRITPAKGYTEGNVQWTIFAANRAKGDLTQDDFIELCKLIIERATTIETTS